MPTRPGRGIGTTAFALGGGAVFVAALGYAVVTFVTTWGLPPGPDAPASQVRAVSLDVALFSVFALHHSLFARLGMKAWVRRTFGARLERPVYVWWASLLFAGTVWAWAPVRGGAWQAGPPASIVLLAVQLAGVWITLDASRQLGIFELAGIREPRAHDTSVPLRDRGDHGFVRHPIYFAWILMVWFAPVMTGSRLTFAIVSTVYLVVAVPFEERALRHDFGPRYDDYCRRVRWRMVPGVF